MTTKPPAGHFSLLYFAGAASFTDRSSETWPAPMMLSDLLAKLEEKYPGIQTSVLDSCAITVNLEYVELDDAAIQLSEADEVALIPPVSSG
jgi:molybdopterin synthase sulfur carrier subunit